MQRYRKPLLVPFCGESQRGKRHESGGFSDSAAVIAGNCCLRLVNAGGRRVRTALFGSAKIPRFPPENKQFRPWSVCREAEMRVTISNHQTLRGVA
ncbi:MAG TPA: hypothetical protein DCG12_03015 [Planctomycetaceae bacterium]|nr:hypothetical protein [Planctomycetaceae bacterium]